MFLWQGREIYKCLKEKQLECIDFKVFCKHISSYRYLEFRYYWVILINYQSFVVINAVPH